MRRATFLQYAATLAATAALPIPARAALALRILIPANPGGGWDTTGRALGQAALHTGAAGAVSYENKGGAAGTLGLAQFVNARRADPGALMVMGAVMLGGILTGRPPVSLAQATPVARLTSEYNVFVLPADSPLRTMGDVVAQLRRDPASVKWGGGSRGSTEHIVAALIAREAGIDPARINYVAFRGGGEATAAVLAGSVTIGGSGLSEFADYIAAGRMRPVCVTSPQRLPEVNVPTLKELGHDIVLGNWRGVYAAPGVTVEQRARLTELVLAALRSPTWSAAMARHGWTPAVLTGPAFDRFVEDEFALLRATMSRAGMI